MRLGLQSRYKSKINMVHPVLAWLMKHGAFLRSACMVGDDGRTPYERRTGKTFLRPLPETGEYIWYQKPMFEGKERWRPDGNVESLQASERKLVSCMCSLKSEQSRSEDTRGDRRKIDGIKEN